MINIVIPMAGAGTVMTTPRQTALACVITSTCKTWPKLMWRQCKLCCKGQTALL